LPNQEIFDSGESIQPPVLEARMLDRLTEQFCDIDDFCKSFFLNWQSYVIDSPLSSVRGPSCGLSESEIMTIIILYHSSHFKNFKTFYNGVVLSHLNKYFPGAPTYQRFIELTSRVFMLLTFYSLSKTGKLTGIYYIDSTSLPVCHNKRIKRHKVFEGLAARGKTSMGWFFGFKLHFVFNLDYEIVAFKVTAGNVNDAKPVPELTKNLKGKLFGDKGYMGKKLVRELLERGLNLMTKVRKNMKSLPMTLEDKMLLNKRNIAETVIGHIKEFSSLRMPKHRSVMNAFTHLLAAITAYQLNPIKKDIKLNMINA
jgi:hypothetical protein